MYCVLFPDSLIVRWTMWLRVGSRSLCEFSYLDLDLVPPVPVGTLGSSLTPERTIRRRLFSLFPIRCWLSSGLPGMFCAMSSLDVIFFACHRLESTTLQPSKVDGLLDAVCGLPSGIYALLQYLPVFLSQFSAGLLRLSRGPDMWRARSCASLLFPFSALTLLVGQQEGHPAPCP